MSDASAEVDRDVKLPLYARAGVREIWLVDLQAGWVEAYREPSPNGYRLVRIASHGDTLSPEAFPDVSLPIAEIIGPESS